MPVLVASDRAEALSEKQTKHTEIIGNPVPQIEYWTKTKDGWGGGGRFRPLAYMPEIHENL